MPERYGSEPITEDCWVKVTFGAVYVRRKGEETNDKKEQIDVGTEKQVYEGDKLYWADTCNYLKRSVGSEDK